MARVERELRARGAPQPWRAHFISGLALAWPDDHVEYFEGRVDGRLVFPPKGNNGFGYDPIFLPDGHSRGFGEMTAQEKHGIPADGALALSHRLAARVPDAGAGVFGVKRRAPLHGSIARYRAGCRSRIFDSHPFSFGEIRFFEL